MDTGQFRNWADLLDDAFHVNSSGKVLDLNAAAAKLLRRKRAESASQPLADLVSDDPQKLNEFLRIASRSRQFVPGALTFKLPDQTNLPCRCDAAVQRSAMVPAC